MDFGAGSSGTVIAAHRGGAGLWPENSLLAFRNAVALGVEQIETDVHLSQDGELIILHDARLDRTTTTARARTRARPTSVARRHRRRGRARTKTPPGAARS